MSVLQSINTAREALPNLAPTAEQLKEGTRTVCRNAYETIKGSGHIVTEISKVKDRCIDLPAEAAADTLKACTELLSLHPINATTTLAKGAAKACANTAALMFSPAPLVNATFQSSLRTAGAGLRGVANAPLAMYRRGERMVTSAADLIFGPESSTPANDNNPSPPPATSANAPTPQAA